METWPSVQALRFPNSCHTWDRSVGSTCPFSSVAEPGTEHRPSFSQLLKLGICCRSLIHFIEASKNLPQPVQVLRLRNRYSIRSLSVQISKDFCHREVVDVAPGLIGDVGAFACANFRENLCFCQLEKSGANQADGDFQFFGNFLSGGSLLSVEKRFDAMVSDDERDYSFEWMTQSRTIRFKFERRNILTSKRNFGAKKNDKPAQL